MPLEMHNSYLQLIQESKCRIVEGAKLLLPEARMA